MPLALGQGIGSELRQFLCIAIIGDLIVSQVLTLSTTPVIDLHCDRLRDVAKGPDRRPTPPRDFCHPVQRSHHERPHEEVPLGRADTGYCDPTPLPSARNVSRPSGMASQMQDLQHGCDRCIASPPVSPSLRQTKIDRSMAGTTQRTDKLTLLAPS